MADRKEATNDITVSVSPNEIVTVESLSLTEEYDVEMIYGSGMTFPSGYAIKQASFSGSMTIQGNRKDLKEKFFTSEGIPKICDSITISHLEKDDGTNEVTSYEEIIVTNKGYEASDGEVTETSYEFLAMSVDDREA